MVGNLVRRRFFAPGDAPPADGVNIDGFMAMNDIPHLPAPHVRASDMWQVKLGMITDAADAGTGFGIGWGEGQSAWDVTSSEAPPGTTALETLLGIHQATWGYVTPDVAGAINFLEYGTRWTLAPGMTRYLYCEAEYLATEEPGETIREMGLYSDTISDAGLEADPYWPVANIDTLGTLVALDRIFLSSRSPDTSGKVRFILRVGHA